MRAIERAAEAIAITVAGRSDFALPITLAELREGVMPIARAAILAFLDGVDKEALVHAAFDETTGSPGTVRRGVRAVLAALRAQAGETK